MPEEYFLINFHYNGTPYEGTVRPENKNEDGQYTSWHVVLNNVFFGCLSRFGKTWQADEERPLALIEVVGAAIDYNKDV